MEDVQNHSASIPITIDRVGIKNFLLPLQVAGKNGIPQATVAEAAVSVDLSKTMKGTHMSRLVDCLGTLTSPVDSSALEQCLKTIKQRLDARYAYISLEFPYFIEQKAPVTGESAKHCYVCRYSSELNGKGLQHMLDITVPVMTVCPCSKAISKNGAHSQRADIHAHLELLDQCFIEDIVSILDQCGSSPTYPLLKREDEKYVTEKSFATPCFVEDAVRNAANALERLPYIGKYTVEVESYESIHGHNAFAQIERVGS